MTAEAGPPADPAPEAVTRRLVPWLVPYVVLCLLGAWRLASVPESHAPFGPVLTFYPDSWWIILGLEALPVVALVPYVWRWLPMHAVVGLSCIMTMATDLLLFSWCMIKVLSPLALLLMAFFMIKAGFDGWVLCRAIERWELRAARSTRTDDRPSEPRSTSRGHEVP